MVKVRIEVEETSFEARYPDEQEAGVAIVNFGELVRRFGARETIVRIVAHARAQGLEVAHNGRLPG